MSFGGYLSFGLDYFNLVSNRDLSGSFDGLFFLFGFSDSCCDNLLNSREVLLETFGDLLSRCLEIRNGIFNLLAEFNSVGLLLVALSDH